MPMDLRNAPETFRTPMRSIFYDYIDVFMVIYLDDILLYSTSVEDHFKHLHVVLSRLRKDKVYVDQNK